ncbi:MAG TPA: hypothetical protein VFY28_02555 [Candidatus Paceibacterota bacterium]|nr:hypothetical protein [Candidatus Paceibacterota bacterium]
MKRHRRSIAHHTGIYPFLVSLPDRFYPFTTKVGGEMVRGKRSYDAALARARRKFGPGHFGYKVLAYRQACHLAGAITLIILATLLAQRWFGSDAALYGLLAAAIAAVTFQEFYLHPKYYGQLWRKSVADWMVWVTPIVLFLLFHTG